LLNGLAWLAPIVWLGTMAFAAAVAWGLPFWVVIVGPWTLGAYEPTPGSPGRPLRFTALFQGGGVWVAVTDRDDVLAVCGVERVEEVPEGGLVLYVRESVKPWVAFDAGGSVA